MNKPELLAPAGNMESFYQAINAGADAIYLSGKSFGARSYAANFTEEELKEALILGKIYGVKVYVTMNTLIKESEVQEFLNQVEFLYQNGVDAILMQDFGMICLCLEKYPNLEIHASTQFNSTSLETIELLYELGVKRVVLPREFTLEEIKAIRIPIEKEVFVHGALCTSYSGRCYMSQMQGGRSGNRGECAGCCRLPYKLYQGEKLLKQGYLLSMKDLNTSKKIEELLPYVDSLKIEGRMKSPAYVYYVTSYYKKLIEKKESSKEEQEQLKSLFYRGYTEGHLFQDQDLVNTKSPNHLGIRIGKVIEVTEEEIKIKLEEELHQEDGIRFVESKKGMIVNYLSDQKGNFISKGEKGQIISIENKVDLKTKDQVNLTTNKKLITSLPEGITKRVPVRMKFSAKINTPWSLSIIDDKNHQGDYLGTVVEEAKNAPTSTERIKEQLERLGNTPFVCQEITIEKDNNIFVRIGDLNIARRTLSERLIGLRRNDYKEPLQKEEKQKERIKEQEPFSLEEYVAVPKKLFRVKEALKEKSILQEIIKIPKGKKVIGGASLNVYNSYTAYYLFQLGYQAITLSIELTQEEQQELCQIIEQKHGEIPLLIPAEGRVDVMIIKGNLLGLEPNQIYHLKDPKNRDYPVIYDGRLTHIKASEALKKNNIIGKNVFYATEKVL